MAVKVVSAGSVAYGTTSLSVPRPVGVSEYGGMDVLFVVAKPNTTISTPSGWTSSLVNSTPTGSAGTDTGPMRLHVFSREADLLTGNVAVTITGGAVAWGQIVRVRSDLGRMLAIGGQSSATNDTTAGASFSAGGSMATSLLAAGSLVLGAAAIPTNDATLTAVTLVEPAGTGATWADTTKVLGVASTALGTHLGGVLVARELATAGTSAGTYRVTATATGTTTNVYGGVAMMSVYERPAPVLRAAWNFEEESGPAIDRSGNGFDMTLDTGVRTAGRRSLPQMLDDRRLSSSTGRLGSVTGAPLMPSGRTAITFTGWWTKYGSNTGDLFQIRDAGGVVKISGFLDGNKPGFYMVSSGTTQSYFTTNENTQDGVPIHLAMRWDGATMRVFINGKIQNESAAISGPTDWNGTLMNVGAEPGQTFTVANCDELRVWDGALSADEITRDMLTPVGYTPTSTPSWPTRNLTSDGHYILDQNGQPYFLAQASAWLTFLRLPPIKYGPYFAARAERGFNGLYATLCRGGATVDGTTSDGLAPFLDAALTPNPEYWSRAREFVRAAAPHGITILAHIFATWESAWLAFKNATDAQTRAFGEWLGDYFADEPNVIWLIGGDWGPNADFSTQVARCTALLTGIRAAGDTHHITVHEQWESHSVGIAGILPFVTISMPYTYNATYYRTRLGYATGLPSVLIEATYDGYDAPDEVLRRQELWSLTTGQFGHGYGDRMTWTVEPQSNGVTWRETLVTPRVNQLKYAADKFKALPGWSSLVPDTGNTLVTSGRGVEQTTQVDADPLTNDYATAAITPDKALAVVYVPSARVFEIDTTRLGASPQVTRVDPTGALADYTTAVTGSTFQIGTVLQPAHADGATDYLWVITATPSGSAYTGSVALSGSGTQTRAGVPATGGSAALSGSGTLGRSGTPAAAGSAALSGSGTLVPAGSPAFSQGLAFQGSGALDPSGAPGFSGSAALSGSGTVGDSGAPSLADLLARTGSGTVTPTGAPGMGGTAALSGEGVLLLSAGAGSDGLLALGGQGVLLLAGVPVIPGNVVLSGGGTLAFNGTPVTVGAVLLGGSGDLALLGQAGRTGSLALSGVGTLSLSGYQPGGTQGTILVDGTERPMTVTLWLNGAEHEVVVEGIWLEGEVHPLA